MCGKNGPLASIPGMKTAHRSGRLLCHLSSCFSGGGSCFKVGITFQKKNTKRQQALLTFMEHVAVATLRDSAQKTHR